MRMLSFDSALGFVLLLKSSWTVLRSVFPDNEDERSSSLPGGRGKLSCRAGEIGKVSDLAEVGGIGRALFGGGDGLSDLSHICCCCCG